MLTHLDLFHCCWNLAGGGGASRRSSRGRRGGCRRGRWWRGGRRGSGRGRWRRGRREIFFGEPTLQGRIFNEGFRAIVLLGLGFVTQDKTLLSKLSGHEERAREEGAG